MSVGSYAGIAIAGYLLGGIPTAYLAGRLKGVDLRRHGSGNVGGTNAVRVLGWRVGIPVLALDILKGYAAGGLLPRLPWVGDPVYLGLAAGLGAVLGHVFTPYLGFRGGKGVAAGAGVLLALAPLPTLIASSVFLVLAFSTGIVSVGSLGATAALPLAAFLLDRFAGIPVHPAVQGLAVGLVPFVVWTHRGNVRRLLLGTENRFRRPWERRG
ncbi:MAG: glycerol-3-phosphate 1-O-acyltransferase PlsY [Candidatus Bipolaricaulota bacterium]|nr:glycerol-3-phosphate 1-O-acyltransferase PlsY [Candidatus Bipolaricaulota bacterium]